MVQWISHHCIAVLKGWLQRGQMLSLHKDPHGKDKGQEAQIVWEKFPLDSRKNFFYSENNQSLGQSSQVHGRSPLLEVYKMQLDRVPDNLI